MYKNDHIDLTEIITRIIQEITATSNQFSHVDVNRLLVCLGSNRRNGRGGTLGKLVPLRFEKGAQVLKYRSRYYTIPEVIQDGVTFLYLIYFYMPRFFDLDPDEKLKVIFHELYHISPDFDGDIRRMGAVKKAHGHSRNKFDLLYEEDLISFREHIRQTPLIDFLELDSKSIFKLYRTVTGRRMKHPKPIKINS